MAVVGISLPVGLALAVYLSSASTISATPVSLPASAIGTADPQALAPKDKPKPQKKTRDEKSSSGTTTDNHGGTTAPSGGTTTSGGGSSTEDRSGSDGNSGSGGSGSDDRFGIELRSRLVRLGLGLGRLGRGRLAPAAGLNHLFTPTDRTFTGNAPALGPARSTVDE